MLCRICGIHVQPRKRVLGHSDLHPATKDVTPCRSYGPGICLPCKAQIMYISYTGIWSVRSVRFPPQRSRPLEFGLISVVAVSAQQMHKELNAKGPDSSHVEVLAHL